jgi:methionyl-tRNA synthetase
VEKNSRKTFYISTPIYYVNDVPHIGHAYTTIITDAISRYKKLAGFDVFFLTGTDEHGQKVEKSAQEKGLKPIELADRVVLRFQDLWKSLNINYDFFIRTTQSIHEKGVQKIFRKLRDKGDIYKDIYEGYYCISDENFLPEDVALEKEGHKICPDCGKECGLVSEECYFFKLSAYQDRLLDHYSRNPEFVRPQSRMNEVVSFVRQGLKDLSITRTTVKWAIQVPDDPDHTIYVWFDALHNYLTGVGYDWNRPLYEKFWPADVHFIGKDILRFHAIYWPAFLLAAEFPLPQTVFGHGWWLKDDSKMSKSKGNVLDPHLLLNTFGPDPIRYFLLREIPIGLDGNFSHEGFLHRVNSDLANDFGNLVQRTLTMIHHFFGGSIGDMGEESADDEAIKTSFEKMKEKVVEHYERYSLNKALEEIWAYLNSVNKYLAKNEPWKIARDPKKKMRLGRILYQATAALRGIALLVFPVMPDSAQKIWDCIGEKNSIEKTLLSRFRFEEFHLGQRTLQPEPLFPRVQLEDFLKDEEIPLKPTHKEVKVDQITFEEFKKMDLRVGEILKAERVEGTDKLLKFEVNIGSETRQMVAGVADTYPPEELTGKKLVVIVNLKPAVIRGVESQAMLLAAEVEGKAIIPFFLEDVPAGAKVR